MGLQSYIIVGQAQSKNNILAQSCAEMNGRLWSKRGDVIRAKVCYVLSTGSEIKN